VVVGGTMSIPSRRTMKSLDFSTMSAWFAIAKPGGWPPVG
jgi:hypothetical protein